MAKFPSLIQSNLYRMQLEANQATNIEECTWASRLEHLVPEDIFESAVNYLKHGNYSQIAETQ